MAIEPDIKDWTWVLDEPCAECGFAAADFPPTEIAGRVRMDLPRWEAVLQRADVRDRPNPSTWSPLEYAAHVRDVYLLFVERTALMIAEVNPQFANWDQDETAIADDYAGQDPAEVAQALVQAGENYASLLDGIGDWERQGRRSNGSTFTVATLAQYGLHDVVHHLHDVNG